jgi:hypothetical protein
MPHSQPLYCDEYWEEMIERFHWGTSRKMIDFDGILEFYSPEFHTIEWNWFE